MPSATHFSGSAARSATQMTLSFSRQQNTSVWRKHSRTQLTCRTHYSKLSDFSRRYPSCLWATADLAVSARLAKFSWKWATPHMPSSLLFPVHMTLIPVTKPLDTAMTE